VMVWIGFIWLRTTSSGGLCVLSVVAWMKGKFQDNGNNLSWPITIPASANSFYRYIWHCRFLFSSPSVFMSLLRSYTFINYPNTRVTPSELLGPHPHVSR
jgi:hypothetical protein